MKTKTENRSSCPSIKIRQKWRCNSLIHQSIACRLDWASSLGWFSFQQFFPGEVWWKNGGVGTAQWLPRPAKKNFLLSFGERCAFSKESLKYLETFPVSTFHSIQSFMRHDFTDWSDNGPLSKGAYTPLENIKLEEEFNFFSSWLRFIGSTTSHFWQGIMHFIKENYLNIWSATISFTNVSEMLSKVLYHVCIFQKGNKMEEERKVVEPSKKKAEDPVVAITSAIASIHDICHRSVIYDWYAAI